MIVIHKGFDGLDLSLQGHISPDFNDALADAKERAADSKHDVLLEYNGVKMHVSETGAKGG